MRIAWGLFAGFALAIAIGAFADDAEPDPRYIIVAFGDSTTAPRMVDGQPLDVYAEHLKRALASGENRANVINAGVPGHTTRDGLARMNRDVLAHQPNIVIIQFGINDAAVDVWKNPPATVERVPLAEYKRNLRKMVEAVRQQGGRAVLMTPNPMRWTDALRKLYNKPPYEPDEVDGLNVRLREYAEAMRAVAQELKVPLVDVYEAMQQYDAADNQALDDLLLDGMHPNDRGHALVANVLLETVRPMLVTTPAQTSHDIELDRQGREMPRLSMRSFARLDADGCAW